MPPKEAPKKAFPTIARPAISDASLLYVPDDAVEGYQERIETGINWNLTTRALKYHKEKCLNENRPTVPFSKALKNKIKKSILHGFFDQESVFSLEEQWELLLPITLWDIERLANEEAKICFYSVNNITDDVLKLIRKAVKFGDRELLRREFKMVPILRVTGAEMTELDKGLSKFEKLISLNLCGNFIKDIDATFLPPSLRTLELQVNRISNVDMFAEHLPLDLLYLGLAKNMLRNEGVEALNRLPHSISCLDLSENDIYNLEAVLDVLSMLPFLNALSLAGNPCSVCNVYAPMTTSKLPRLKFLDSREILPTDRPSDPYEPHPDDIRSNYFTFTVIRIMSAPQPPKPDKGAITTFHVELELPLLDAPRRRFLLFRRHESLVELLPPPEDDWPVAPSTIVESKMAIDVAEGESSHDSDIYLHLTTKNSREICHFTTFESTRVQWNKLMNFQEPAIKIFCPDLVALRDTFRTVVTLKLVYSVTSTAKQSKPDNKKSLLSIKVPSEQRVVLATIKCALKTSDWSQTSQHFHWDDSLGTNDAIHWGDGDLSILQYTQAPVKATKGVSTDPASSRQQPPDNLTCHFGFAIDTMRF